MLLCSAQSDLVTTTGKRKSSGDSTTDPSVCYRRCLMRYPLIYIIIGQESNYSWIKSDRSGWWFIGWWEGCCWRWWWCESRQGSVPLYNHPFISIMLYSCHWFTHHNQQQHHSACVLSTDWSMRGSNSLWNALRYITACTIIVVMCIVAPQAKGWSRLIMMQAATFAGEIETIYTRYLKVCEIYLSLSDDMIYILTYMNRSSRVPSRTLAKVWYQKSTYLHMKWLEKYIHITQYAHSNHTLYVALINGMI